MSIEGMCQNEITIQTEAATNDEQFGSIFEVTESRTAACLVQELSAMESARHGVVGTDRSYMIFFPADPEITNAHRLVWKERKLRIVGPPVTEGRPGEDMLWWVIGQELTNRQEQ